MKKIFALLLLGVFFISFTSAGYEWDNKLDYEEDDMKVRLSNSFMGIIKTSEIGTAELKSHNYSEEVINVEAGNDTVVMFYDFEFNEFYKNGLGDVEFIDMKSGKVIQKDYNFVVWKKVEKEINTYDEKCEYKEIYNKTVCEYEKNGTIIYDSYDWIKISSKDIPQGRVRIGLSTEVNFGDHIDGIWKIAGKKVSKHAEWSASLNDSLIVYYALDETSGSVVDELGNQSGTIVSPVIRGEDGIFNKSFEFDGSAGTTSYVNITGLSMSSTNFTYNMWVNSTNSGQLNSRFFSTETGRTDLYWECDAGTGICIFDGTATRILSNAPPTSNVWHMITFVLDGSSNTVFLYIDGSFNSSATFTPRNIGGSVAFPSRFNGEASFEGLFDEFAIWQRSLSASEISGLWNNGDGTFYKGVGSSSPQPILISPENNSNLTTQSVTFQANVTDAIKVDNVTLYIDGVANQTNTSGVNGSYIFSQTLANGDYNWSILAWNNQSLSNQSDTWDFNVNFTESFITILSPENISYATSSILFQIDASGVTDVDSCWFNLNDGDNVSMDAPTGNVNLSTQDSAPAGLFFKDDGTKLYEVGYGGNLFYQYICTDAWNLSSCSYESVNLSTQNSISRGLFFKDDGTKLYEVGSSGDLFYQYICTDAWNLSSCSYESVNLSTQDSIPAGLFFKDDGTKLYEVGYGGDLFYQYICTDAWNLSSCSYESVNLSTQDSIPRGLFFKDDGTKLYEVGSSGNLFYQYICTDAWNLSSCSYESVNLSTQDSADAGLFFKDDGTKLYEVGSSGNLFYQYICTDAWNLSSCSYENTVYTYTNSSVPDGSYDTKFYCNSTSVNTTNASVTFTVDTVPPKVAIQNPINTSYTTVQTTLNYTATNGNLDSCWYSLDGGSTNVSAPGCANITGLDSGQGSSTWTVYANDTAGNENSSSVTFFVDSVAPEVSINSPINQTYTTSEILFSVDATDTTSSVDSCWFNLNDGDNVSMSNLGNNTYTYTNSSVPDGSYTTNYFCNDTLNNVNGTESVTFSIDTTAPVIDVHYPNGTLTFNEPGNNETLNVTFTDPDLDTCWYDYNGTNVTISGCTSGVITSTQFILEEDNFNMTVYANDTFGNFNSQFVSWNYLFEKWNVTYTTPQYESTLGTFILNAELKDDETISSAYMTYNGTNYTTSIIFLSGEYYITSAITLPSVENATNFTFTFYVVVGGNTYNLGADTQEVQPINFITCVGTEDLLMNISLYDEELKTPLQGDLELNLQVYSYTSDDLVAEFNNSYTNIYSQEICLSPNESYSSLYLDAEIRYEADGYVPEFYYIQSSNLSQYPVNLSLFDLSENSSTEFLISYKNDDFIFEEGAIIQLQRKYIGEDLYEVVEAPITADGGKAVVHVDLNVNKYKATVVKDGEVLDIFDTVVFKCDNELSGDCTEDLQGNVDSNNDVPIETITDFAYSISFDEDNNTVDVTFSVPSGTPSDINVLLEQKDMFGNTTSCNTTITTSAGSISCSYNYTIDRSILELSISKNDVQLVVESYLLDTDLDFDGMNYFIVFMFTISLVGMAIASPEWMIIITVMVLLISGTILLIKGTSLVMGLGSIAWLIIAAGIIIFKLAKQEDR